MLWYSFQTDHGCIQPKGQSLGVIETALGGMNLTRTVEGRERYPIRVRYQRNLREQIDELSRLPVVSHSGEVVPLQMLAKMKTTWGPGVINSEDARLVAHVSFSPSGAVGDLETVQAVEDALHEAQTSGELDLPDVNLLSAAIANQSDDLQFDLNADSQINQVDLATHSTN